MTLTTPQMAAAFADALEAQGVALTDKPDFIADFAGMLGEWLGGADALPADVALRLIATLGNWNSFAAGMLDFLTIEADGGENGDGKVTITDAAGVVRTIDSRALLTVSMAGIRIIGTLPNQGSLPAADNRIGDIYLIAGDGWTWTGASWINVGPIRGPQGPAGTIEIGEVVAVAPGVPPQVVNTGTPSAAVINFALQQGAAATIGVGGVTTVAPGQPAAVENTGSSHAAVLQFSIPRGEKGDQGEAYQVDALGPIADRGGYDLEAPGFSFLATDEQQIYFRLDPAGWTAGAPFGKGDPGASAYQVAVANGFAGDEAAWLASLDGAPGSDAEVTLENIEAALGATPVLSINGQGADAGGAIELDLSSNASLRALQQDMSRVLMAISTLRATQFGTPNGVANAFDDQSGIDLANSVNALWTAGAYTGTALQVGLPAMTADNAPAGHNVTGPSNSGFGAWRAFDGKNAAQVDNYYTTTDTLGGLCRITRIIPEAIVLGSYTIAAPLISSNWAGLGAPRTWTLEVTSDGVNWTLVDTRSAVPAWNAGEKRTYVPSAGILTPVIGFRLNITASAGSTTALGSYVLIGEIDFLRRDSYLQLDLRSSTYEAATQPSTGHLAVIAKGADPIDINVGLKGYVSRDGGATWLLATLSPAEQVGAYTLYEAAEIDLTGLPAGSAMRWRFETTTNTELALTGAILTWS